MSDRRPYYSQDFRRTEEEGRLWDERRAAERKAQTFIDYCRAVKLDPNEIMKSVLSPFSTGGDYPTWPF